MGTPELRTCYNKWRYHRPLKYIYGDKFILRLSGIGKKKNEYNEGALIRKLIKEDVTSHRRKGWIHALIVLVIDYIVGVGMFLHHSKNYKSSDSGDEPNSWIDAFYFVTVTITTVGFGDITLASTLTKSFIVFMALASCGFYIA